MFVSLLCFTLLLTVRATESQSLPTAHITSSPAHLHCYHTRLSNCVDFLMGSSSSSFFVVQSNPFTPSGTPLHACSCCQGFSLPSQPQSMLSTFSSPFSDSSCPRLQWAKSCHQLKTSNTSVPQTPFVFFSLRERTQVLPASEIFFDICSTWDGVASTFLGVYVPTWHTSYILMVLMIGHHLKIVLIIPF